MRDITKIHEGPLEGEFFQVLMDRRVACESSHDDLQWLLESCMAAESPVAGRDVLRLWFREEQRQEVDQRIKTSREWVQRS